MKNSIKLPLLASAFAAAVSVQASTDYGPAIWNPPCNANWYTSGYGHKFHVIHDIEGYYLSTISMFKGCGYTSASIHYVVNGKKDATSDAPAGEITQMVRDAYYAWHARCWNQHATGTEHEGFASNPAWYTDVQYQSSAGISANLANKFGYAKDRNHIIAHGQKSVAGWPAYASANLGIDPYCNTHTDPGPYWDWNKYMGMVNSGGCNIGLTQGAIRAKYESIGGCGSFIGSPTTGETATPDGVGRYNHFSNNGSIYWTPSTDAHFVWGAIRTKWSQLAWEAGVCGYPTTDETTCPDGVGKFNHFTKGASIYWTPSTGAQEVGGAIRSKWEALGWETGRLGYPTTSETALAGGGAFNHFQGGSIYYSPATGAHSVWGAIRDKWSSLGWETSCLGYPTTDEYASGGGVRQDFQFGNITWTSAGGAISSCGPPPLVDVTVDNSAAGFSVLGTWASATGATDKFGADYRYRSTAAVSEPATWAASLSASGNYTVSAWWAQGSNRSATAPYVITHSAGSTTVNANQQANGGKWNSLGTFNLAAGNNTVKLSCWTSTGFIVLADAVRWQQQ